MASPLLKSVRENTTPFLLQLFYRTGALHRADEFQSQSLPPHISVYTWSDCTLQELALDLAATKPSAFPSPSVGCRLVFQLVFPDLRNTATVPNSPPRFGAKDLGSVVIGGDSSSGAPGDISMNVAAKGSDDKHKTLSGARFVVGDYITCAILPPLPDGLVAPASSVRSEQASGSHERGHGISGRRGSKGSRGDWRDEVGGDFPMGEWRRGERLPDALGGRPKGRGRW
ncbi:Sin3 associated polypeptide p18-domain-containing protein [Fusarium venenatum]|uniref:Sin3 associated polypeptide p18-domain-containing protein n=1 Tax=Fusarium venenatum TaxID=56646 RepID=UPI001DB17441|nr:Sin3 associated polypeptide p18-domain-containing protein [Fusarium venenatum]